MSNFYLKPRYRAILKEANLDNKEADKVLKNGVFLQNKQSFYWLGNQRPPHVDCYVVLAEHLTLSDQSNSWEWEAAEPCKQRPIKVAKLGKAIRWLEVTGSFSTVNLQLYTTYEVSFCVKVSPADNNEYPIPKNGYPINLSLMLPNRTRQETQETIADDKDAGWKYLVAGKFYHTFWTIGTMHFSLKNVDSLWKNGISILGVYIKPREVDPKDILNWEAFAPASKTA